MRNRVSDHGQWIQHRKHHLPSSCIFTAALHSEFVEDAAMIQSIYFHTYPQSQLNASYGILEQISYNIVKMSIKIHSSLTTPSWPDLKCKTSDFSLWLPKSLTESFKNTLGLSFLLNKATSSGEKLFTGFKYQQRSRNSERDLHSNTDLLPIIAFLIAEEHTVLLY